MDNKKVKKIQNYIDGKLKSFDFDKIETSIHHGKQFELRTIKIEYHNIKVNSILDESIIEDQIYQGVLNLLNQLNDMEFMFTWIPDYNRKGTRTKEQTFHQITTPYPEVVFALHHAVFTGEIELSTDVGNELKESIVELN